MYTPAPTDMAKASSTPSAGNSSQDDATRLSTTAVTIGVTMTAIFLFLSLLALAWYLVHIRRELKAPAEKPAILESIVSVEAIKGDLDDDTDCDIWRYRASWESTTGRSAFDNDRDCDISVDDHNPVEPVEMLSPSVYSRGTDGWSLWPPRKSEDSIESEQVDWTAVQPC